LRLLGAGDIVVRTSDTHLTSLAESAVRGTRGSRLALLDDAVLVAVRRWPTIAVRLLERYANQTQTLAAQFVIAQLPRAEQRVFTLMWLLAERWGQVTRFGTHLPLQLTHETLGLLIGASRPSVSLALRELCDRGALIKQDRGWFLLEPPPQTHSSRPSEAAPTTSLRDRAAASPDESPTQANHGAGCAAIAARGRNPASGLLQP
jgi:CRP/FNR family transcriptional regulator, cyclic AMP receptor protein